MKRNKSFEISLGKLEKVIGAPPPALYSRQNLRHPKISLPQFGNSFAIFRKSDLQKGQSSKNLTPSSSFGRLQQGTEPIPKCFGLSSQDYKEIYVSKCKDLGILPVAQLEKRYFAFLDKVLKDRSVNFKENRLGPHSAETIGKILSKNSSFSKLNLPKNLLGDEGAMNLAKNLKKNKSLIHVDLSSNAIKADGGNFFLKSFKDHESLISIDISSHEGLNKNRLGPFGIAPIRELLQENTILTMLNLCDTLLGPEGFGFVIEGIRVNKSLQVLNLSRNHSGGKIIKELLEAVATSCLVELYIAGNQISIEGSEAIGDFFADQSFKNNTLKLVDAGNNEITHKASARIFGGLKVNAAITTLNLEKNPLSELAGNGIMYCLEENLCLKFLNLSECGLKESGVHKICEGLLRNMNLKTLILHKNFIKDSGAISLSDCLEVNNILTTLDISNNKIGNVGMKKLVNSLGRNNSIAFVNLKDNPINDEIGQKIADLTRNNTNIQGVKLEGTLVSVQFLHQISANLKKTQVLSRIESAKKIKNRLEELSSLDLTTDKIYKKIVEKKQTQIDMVERLKVHKITAVKIQVNFLVKLEKLKKEYEELLKKSEKLNEIQASAESTLTMEKKKYLAQVSKHQSRLCEIDREIQLFEYSSIS